MRLINCRWLQPTVIIKHQKWALAQLKTSDEGLKSFILRTNDNRRLKPTAIDAVICRDIAVSRKVHQIK